MYTRYIAKINIQVIIMQNVSHLYVFYNSKLKQVSFCSLKQYYILPDNYWQFYPALALTIFFFIDHFYGTKVKWAQCFAINFYRIID